MGQYKKQTNNSLKGRVRRSWRKGNDEEGRIEKQ
jgi:hypothetical protein